MMDPNTTTIPNCSPFYLSTNDTQSVLFSLKPQPVEQIPTDWTSNYLLSIFLLYICWEANNFFKVYHTHKPKNLLIVGNSNIFANIVTGFKSLFDTRGLIASGYAQARGKPFAIPHRERFLVCVSSPEQIEEVAVESTRKHSKLSAQGIMVDFRINKADFEPSVYSRGEKDDPKGFIASNLLKHKIRLSLPDMYIPMLVTVADAFRKEMKGTRLESGWNKVSLWSVANRITGRMNNILLVGDELANNKTFFESSMQFITDATVTLSFLGHIPKFLFRPVSFLTMNWSGGRATMKNLLMAEISRRRKQVLIVNTEHFVAFVLYNLCLHPEYLDKLREEIQSIKGNEFVNLNTATPYMDSFIREVGRMHPLTNIALPRKVMSQSGFTFEDGTHVPKDNWLCVPHYPLMNLPETYSNPNDFQGFRFVNEEGTGSTDRFWDMSRSYPFWGNPKTGCPARYFVSLNLKMIMMHFIENYDFKLVKQSVNSTFSYHVLEIPHPLLTIQVRERNVGSV